MPKKKSAQKAAADFRQSLSEIESFLQRSTSSRSATSQDKTWLYDLAIIRVYREFEDLMLNVLIACLNSDSETFSQHKGISFPKHMNANVCEFLITGDGYFDFRGREGLIKDIKRFVVNDHWLVEVVKDSKFKPHIDQMCALRNFAAHDSTISKKRALEVIDKSNLSAAGAWLKVDNRFKKLCLGLSKLAEQIQQKAPY